MSASAKMTNRTERIVATLSANEAKIKSFGVRSLSLFGSSARGENTPESDLDFVVEFEKKSFDSYMDLKLFLEEHGFQVAFARGLGYERIPEGAATQEILFKLGVDVYANSSKADALVISCGGLKTLDLIVPLENQIKVPVVSSTPHGLMNGVRLLGISARVHGFGMVLAKA